MEMRFLRKLTNLLLVVALLALGLSALADPADPACSETLEGTIQEVTEDGILIAPYEGAAVLARLPENLVIEGPAAPLPGMPVTVTYNGVMTRSIPAQITAEAVSIPTLTGAIASVGANQFLLERDNGLGPVLVHLGEDSVIPADYVFAVGNRLQVVFGGVMALSMPPQAGAMFVLPLPSGE